MSGANVIERRSNIHRSRRLRGGDTSVGGRSDDHRAWAFRREDNPDRFAASVDAAALRQPGADCSLGTGRRKGLLGVSDTTWAGPDLEWHFAGAYKALVGELPSATLGRPPE